MKSLWFKSKYVDPILNGDKIDTIRKAQPPINLKVGDVIAAQVGPRSPFALLEITDISIIGLPFERQAEICRLYPGVEKLTRISFRVAEEYIPKA